MTETMNILRITDTQVVFEGFPLLSGPYITVKVFGGGLVIEPGKLPPFDNRYVFPLSDHKSSDKTLIDLLRMHSVSLNDIYIETEGAYLQAKSVSQEK